MAVVVVRFPQVAAVRLVNPEILDALVVIVPLERIPEELPSLGISAVYIPNVGTCVRQRMYERPSRRLRPLKLSVIPGPDRVADRKPAICIVS